MQRTRVANVAGWVGIASVALWPAFTFAQSPLSPQSVVDLDAEDTRRQRTVPVRIYLPLEKDPRPVILCSHGLGGSRAGKQYLGETWSKAGFVCVFLQHAGSDQDVVRGVPPGQRMQKLKAAITRQSNRDRIQDVTFILDKLEKWVIQPDHVLAGRIDLARVGMTGHSFGAATTLAVAGKRFPLQRSYRDDRIDAFLAMSPQPGKGLTPSRAFGMLQQPILCMTGTKDTSPITPDVTPESRVSVYEGLPDGDKYLLVFKDGYHHTFNGGPSRFGREQNPQNHRAIEALSTKFWQAYLEQDQEAKQWLQSDQPKSENLLIEADRWEWK